MEDVISVSIVHPVWARTKPDSATDLHCGWQFKNSGDPPVTSAGGKGEFECDDALKWQPEIVDNAHFLRDLYEKCNAPPNTKFSVPVLWCKKTHAIVNNESSEIIRMFNSEFNALAKHPEIDLYPEKLHNEIEELNTWVYSTINDGVYKCGFAQDQASYDANIGPLYNSLEKLEKLLSKQRYLAGDLFTEADVRSFMTLVRFDEVYVVYFKTNCKAIREYHNIMNYCRDIYSIPEMRKCINMRHIKCHYYASHPLLNHFAVIPKGPDFLGLLNQPHDRDRFD